MITDFSRFSFPFLISLSHYPEISFPVLNRLRQVPDLNSLVDLVSMSLTSFTGNSFHYGRNIPKSTGSNSYLTSSTVHLTTPEFTFTVFSYNALAPTYVDRHLRELYSQCAEKNLNWEKRKFRLLTRILVHKADVVCLQEVEEVHFFDFFLPRLSMNGYDGRFKKRTLDIPDGVAIFYKTDRLQLTHLRGVEFNKGLSILDRDNVGLIAVLAPVSTITVMKPDEVCRPVFEPIVVATTHLLFNPKRGDIKLAQLALLLAELDLVARRIKDPLLINQYESPNGPPLSSGYSHVVLCGDFNLEPHCPLFNFLVKGSLEYRGLDRVRVSGLSELGPVPPLAFPFPDQLLPFDLGISATCKRFDVADQANRRFLSDGKISHGFDFRSVYHRDEDETEAEIDVQLSQQKPYTQQEPYTQQQPYTQPRHQFGCDVRRDSAQSTRSSSGIKVRMSTNHDRASTMVDYVFFNESPSMLLTRRTSLPEKGSCPKMPNDVQGSDHFPVCAQFVIRGEFRKMKLSKS